MFGFLKKDTKSNDTGIYAIATGELIDVKNVPDEVFSNKLLGESIAFKFFEDNVTILSPANGVLTSLFPTGHAFGITMDNNVELLIHLGVNTVNSKGDGFTILDKKQGDKVKVGDPIVSVDLKKLSKTYDMSAIVVITNDNGKGINFISPCNVSVGDRIDK